MIKQLHIQRPLLLLALLLVSFSAMAQTTITLPRTNYSPGGASFTTAATPIDWTSQEVYASINLSGCTGTNECVLSVGSNIGTWANTSAVHLYYTASTSTLIVQNGNTTGTGHVNTSFTASGTIEVIIKSDGLYVNSTQRASATAISGVLALSQIYIGSTEGSSRSHATYNELSIKSTGSSTGGDTGDTGETGDLSETATDKVYDFSGFDPNAIVRLFKQAKDEGNNYPTDEEFEAAGIQQSDLHFVRSHVRYRPIMDRTDNLLGSTITYKQRNLWMNLPMDAGKAADVGQPNGTFNSEVFSIWNYTNIFGAWNHNLFGCPSAWTDAAHKNGSYIYSGIKFFDTGTGSANTEWQSFVTTQSDGSTYDYAEPMINVLMYMGQDGINYNWEASNYTNSNVIAFHQQLHKLATQKGFDEYHSGIYTSVGSLSSRNATALFGNKTGGRTHDLMLNYSSGDFQTGTVLGTSASAANTALGTYEGLYAGVWIVTMNRSWTALNYNNNARRVGICLWGEHDQSRLWQYTTGESASLRQDNYQHTLERLVSGGNRNPLSRPAISNTGIDMTGDNALSTFAGLATWIPERSAIQGDLPFATHFNLGNGDRYSYKGKKTAGPFYNMSEQDIVPTYRWLVVSPGTTTYSTGLTPNFYNKDQYTGGTCLRLTGTPGAGGTDVVLFKTSLNVSAGNPYVKIAVKDTLNGGSDSHLYVILKKGSSWIEIPFGSTSGKTWEEKKIAVSALSQSDVISAIGLRVKSASAVDLLIGKLEVNDDVKAEPAGIKDIQVEVKQETKTSLTAKTWWDIDDAAIQGDRKDYGLTFNDEANIDHFEVMYRNGENGNVVEVGRTGSWGTIVPNIQFESADDDPWIGVRAASTDLKTYSPVRWVHITRADQSKLPAASASGEYGTTAIGRSESDAIGNAINTRYITDVTTTGADQNLNYHVTTNPTAADSTQYCDATNYVLKVKQGQTVRLTFKGNSNYSGTNGMRNCAGKGWIDFNHDYVFNTDLLSENPSEGECIGSDGASEHPSGNIESGVTWTFTIPSDARTGQTRLRLVFTGAWRYGTMTPTGFTFNGYSIDFTCDISGDNPQRPVPADIHDAGTAEQPENLVNITTGISDIAASEGVSEATVADGKLSFSNADKAWLYTVDGAFVSFMPKAETIATSDLPAGVYLVKMRRGDVFRTQKVVVK